MHVLEKPLVIGATGLVGGALLSALERVGQPIGTTRSDAPLPGPRLISLDFANPQAGFLVRSLAPSSVFIPAALTNVEWCETNPTASWTANVTDVERFVAAIGDIPIVYFSSEYVFDGNNGPYDEASQICPLSHYGRQKAEMEAFLSERDALVIRTVHVFGAELRRKNFLYQLLSKTRRGEDVHVPTDQISTPTDVRRLAEISIRLFDDRYRGVMHVAGIERMSRFEFAKLIAQEFDLDESRIKPALTNQLPLKAQRPLDAGLISSRCDLRLLGMRPLREELNEIRSRVESDLA